MNRVPFFIAFLLIAGCGECEVEGTYKVGLLEAGGSNTCLFRAEQRTFTLVRKPGGIGVQDLVGTPLFVDVSDDCILRLEFEDVDVEVTDPEIRTYTLNIDLASSTLAGDGLFESTGLVDPCSVALKISGERVSSKSAGLLDAMARNARESDCWRAP